MLLPCVRFARSGACAVHTVGELMKDESTLIHCEHVSERTFDEVVTAFEKAVGDIAGDAFQKLLAASTDAHDFEARVRFFEGDKRLHALSGYRSWRVAVTHRTAGPVQTLRPRKSAHRTDDVGTRYSRRFARARADADIRRSGDRQDPAGL